MQRVVPDRSREKQIFAENLFFLADRQVRSAKTAIALRALTAHATTICIANKLLCVIHLHCWYITMVLQLQ